MDFGSRASIKLTFIPFYGELNSAINCSEVAANCSCKFTSFSGDGRLSPISLSNYANKHLHREIIVLFVPQLIPSKFIWLKIKLRPIEDGFFIEYFWFWCNREQPVQKSLAKFSLMLHVTSFSLSVLLLTIAANQSARENSDSYCKKRIQFTNASFDTGCRVTGNSERAR